ncbi:MAG: DUF302 domain-containing protein [Gaiellaceae bacterium]
MSTPSVGSYTLSGATPLAFPQALERVRAALAEQGFGVLTEIDVQRTLREKLGEEMPRFVILGTCNPAFAHRALQAEPLIGTLLPCNVVVREAGTTTLVEAIDPQAMLGIAANPVLETLAADVRERLLDALGAVWEG